MGFAVVFEDTSFLTSDDFFRTSALSLVSCQIFIGYIFQDALLCLWYGSRWNGWEANLVHHVCVLIAWSQLTAGGYGQSMALVGLACEISTPFVNFRWMLYKAGMK